MTKQKKDFKALQIDHDNYQNFLLIMSFSDFLVWEKLSEGDRNFFQ
jgi:hypothetical protein